MRVSIEFKASEEKDTLFTKIKANENFSIDSVNEIYYFSSAGNIFSDPSKQDDRNSIFKKEWAWFAKENYHYVSDLT